MTSDHMQLVAIALVCLVLGFVAGTGASQLMYPELCPDFLMQAPPR